MIQRFIGLVAVTLIPLAVWGEQERPTTSPPFVCLATASTKDGQVRVQLSIPKMVPYTVSTMVDRDGWYVPKKSTHYKVCVATSVVTVDGKEVVVSRKGGNAIDPKDLPTLLRKEPQVLVFAEGKIDPYYLGVVRDQVLIIAIPASKDFPWRTKDED